MKQNLDKSKGISSIFKKYVDGNKGKYVAFCRNINHLKKMKSCLSQWFSEAEIDVNFYEVHSRNVEKDKEFKSFIEDDGLSVCLSVGILSEGIHGIDGVILLRDTTSPNLYLQQIGRCFSVDMKSVPIIFDLVANCESIMDCSLKSDLLNAIDKRDKDNKDSDDESDKGIGNDSNKNEITRDDIEKFFVFDQVVDSVRAFRSIEGRLKDSFDLYIQALKQYKEREGDCLVPQRHIEVLEDEIEVKLGNWVCNIRQAKKEKNTYLLTQEKIDELDKMDFIWKVKNRFDKFCKYALSYKEKYGHLDIKKGEKFECYSISCAYEGLRQDYKKGRLTTEQIDALKNIGIDITCTKTERIFKEKMNLARQALDDGVIITQTNNKYKGINLYQWYQTNKNKFTDEEIEVMNRLIPNHYAKKVIIIDMKNENVRVYTSPFEAGKALYNEFHTVNTEQTGMNIIYNRLKGHTKNPIYKNRFRFEYAD